MLLLPPSFLEGPLLTMGVPWACPHSKAGCKATTADERPPPWCLADVNAWYILNRVGEIMKPYLKKPKGPPKSVGMNVIFKDAKFEKEYPFLTAFLTQAEWDDKTVRETGTLTIFVQEGILKVCVNDRAMNRSAFLTGPSWDDLMALLEDKLSDDSLEWRTKK